MLSLLISIVETLGLSVPIGTLGITATNIGWLAVKHYYINNK